MFAAVDHDGVAGIGLLSRVLVMSIGRRDSGIKHSGSKVVGVAGHGHGHRYCMSRKNGDGQDRERDRHCPNH